MRRHASCFFLFCSTGRGRVFEPGWQRHICQKVIMKIKYWLGILLIALGMGSTFTSCEKDDGSTGIEMRMRNSDNGGDRVDLLNVSEAFYVAPYVIYGQQYGGYWENSYVGLSISSSNNFYVYGERCDCDIVCIGNVNGLSRINSIPNSGWASKVAVQPGKGYIIRSKNPTGNYGNSYYNQFCKYARVYVVDWIEGTSGGILGATIRYQDDWK